MGALDSTMTTGISVVVSTVTSSVSEAPVSVVVSQKPVVRGSEVVTALSSISFSKVVASYGVVVSSDCVISVVLASADTSAISVTSST